MILIWLIIIPLIGGLISWLLNRWNDKSARWVSLIFLAIDLVLAIMLWMQHFNGVRLISSGNWLAEINYEWIPVLGINLHLAMDGFSLLLILLAAFLGIVSVAASWSEIKKRTGFFHFNLMWSLAGIIGVFLSLDLFLFYFFWELMLVPMYFLIALWGHERRIYAAIKFFIFTQLSGLFMLAAILGLYFIHGRNTGIYTFDYVQLLNTSIDPETGMWLLLGFVIAFLVKLPAVPFHTWLPDAHTEAPTAGSVILAGLLLKTGAYGLIRFAVPLFPMSAFDFGPVAMTIGVIGIIYGAMLAFAQKDLKRLIAYTSVSHMGFVLLGVFAWNELALQGVVIQIICHGISTGALFILVGLLQERIHTRDLDRMGGIWSIAPRMGGSWLLFGLASLGLPGLGNFVGEFLVLIGTYKVSVPMAAISAAGLVTATVYSLWMIQRTFFGTKREELKFPDLAMREMMVMTAMIVSIIWIGIYPQPIIRTAAQTIQNLRQNVEMRKTDKLTRPYFKLVMPAPYQVRDKLQPGIQASKNHWIPGQARNDEKEHQTNLEIGSIRNDINYLSFPQAKRVGNLSLDTPVKPEYDRNIKSSFPDLIGESRSLFKKGFRSSRNDKLCSLTYELLSIQPETTGVNHDGQ